MAIMPKTLDQIIADETKPAAKRAAKPAAKRARRGIKADPSKGIASPTLAIESKAIESKPAAKDVEKPAKAIEGEKVMGITMITYYTPENVPSSGKAMFAHTCAALLTLGALDQERRSFLGSALTAFRRGADKARSYHLTKGNFERRDGNAVIGLSVAGFSWFYGRALGTTSGQVVSPDEIHALSEAMKNGQWGEGTEHFPKNTKWVSFRVQHHEGKPV